MARAKIVAFVAIGLAVAASLAFVRPIYNVQLLQTGARGRASGKASEHDAYKADLKLLSWLGVTTSLIELTDGQDSADQVLNNLGSYNALVVVTAGRGGPTRRAQDQPFISIALESINPSSSSSSSSSSSQATDMPSESTLSSDGPATASSLSALAAPLSLMNLAAVAVERVLGRRLFPITISLFDRGSDGGPYAIFDASAGSLLLDRWLVPRTWAYDKPEVSYLTGQLADRIFNNVAALLQHGSTAQYDRFVAAAGAAAGGGLAAEGAEGTTVASGDGPSVEVKEALRRLHTAAAAQVAAAAEGGAQLLKGEATARAAAAEDPTAATSSSGTAASDGAAGGAISAEGGATTSSSSAALHLLAAAVAAALPAAFASAPPLWFCILCPSVLGLLAPLLINLSLNQLAGVLCTQMHLTDDACFDVMLGALGAGFVLSLASAVPIFFVCRLPQCAGRNVTEALRRVAGGR